MIILGLLTHPAADIFPLLEGKELDELAADIRTHGLLQPIVVHEGKILDGRNRARACEIAGATPRLAQWSDVAPGAKDPVAWVVSVNLKRRHMDESQRGMVAARAANLSRGRPSDNPPMGGLSEERAAAEVNVGLRTVQRAKEVLHKGTPELVEAVDRGRVPVGSAALVARRPVEEQRAFVARVEAEVAERGKVNPKQVLRQMSREEAIDRIQSEPRALSGRYRVIVADPPWAYEKRKDDGTHRTALSYPDMTTPEICALPIGKHAEDDSILWLWTTNAFMRDAFAVLDAWGFREKTILTWAKDRMGTGDWLRGQTEHCILAVRGKPVVALTNQTTLLRGPLREHSRKPDEFYSLVEALCPGSKLELFSRQPREGWNGWGAELEKFSAGA